MGGGSADAAATLVACDALWGTERRTRRPARPGRPARRRCAVRPRRRHRDRHGTRRPAEPGARHRAVPLGARPAGQRAEHADASTASSTGTASGTSRDIAPAQADAERRLRGAAGAARRRPAHARGVAHERPAGAGHPPRRPRSATCIELGEMNGALAGIVSGSGPTVAFLTADLDSALDLQIALSAQVRGPAPAVTARASSATDGAGVNEGDRRRSPTWQFGRLDRSDLLHRGRRDAGRRERAIQRMPGTTARMSG